MAQIQFKIELQKVKEIKSKIKKAEAYLSKAFVLIDEVNKTKAFVNLKQQ